MKKHVKKALLSGAVLCGLCGVMALAIVGADFLTKETIAHNNIEKEKEGLVKVFGSNADYGEAIKVDDPAYPHLEKYWVVKVDSNEVGRVYRGYGRNGYGDISLLYGLDASFRLGNVITLANSESYGTTLKENYLDVIDSASDKDAALEEVKCGATYGAKLCRSIILDGKAHYKGGAK